MTVTIETLEKTVENLGARRGVVPQAQQKYGLFGKQKVFAGTSQLTRTLMGLSPPPLETPEEIAKLKDALSYISSDVGRGNGSIFDRQKNPIDGYWLGVIWAIANLGWQSGKEIARQWSMESPRYDEQGFEKAWNSYDPTKLNAIGIGSLYKLAQVKGWNQNGLLPRPLQPSGDVGSDIIVPQVRYRLLSGQDLAQITSTRWIVKGLIPSEGLVALYGPSGSGKSFLAFDLAAALARGAAWFGMKVKVSPVVYVALEGEGGYKNRLAAWEQAHKEAVSQNLKFILQPFKLTDPGDVEEIASVVPKHSVVIIDTLNRAAPTTDENSSKEMGILLEASKALQAKINGLVILVAHTGKDATRGLRGHSSLFAALDGAIEVTKSNDNRAWEIAKAKDGVDGLKYPFKLKVHDLGKDEDGDAITSCTVERDNSALFAPSEPSGKVQKEALKHLRGLIRSSQIKGKANCLGSCVRFDDAVDKLAPTLLSTAKNKQVNRARQLINDLVKGGYLHHGMQGDEGWLWL